MIFDTISYIWSYFKEKFSGIVAVGIENRRWTVKLQYEISLGKESKNDNIGVNYNSLTLSVGYKLNVK